jgi:prophage antirepressor-like protein
MFNPNPNAMSVQIFNNPKFGNIRALEIDSNPYFVGNDVATCLGYAKPRNAITQHVDNEDALKWGVPDNQGLTQETIVINESGVYSLVFGSKLQAAKDFKRWVTSEVLPAIRRTGGYMVSTPYETPEQIMARALIVAQETIKRTEDRARMLSEQNELQKQQLQLSAPKVRYFDSVLQSAQTYTMTQVAKELDMSCVALENRLQGMNVIFRQSGQFMLYAKYTGKGYMKSRTHHFTRSDGSPGTNTISVWTEAGRRFVHELLKN